MPLSSLMSLLSLFAWGGVDVAAVDGAIAPSVSQALAVLRRMFARPSAVQLLFAEGMLSRASRNAPTLAGDHDGQVSSSPCIHPFPFRLS